MAKFIIDREKWGKYTIYEQLGNIGAEVGRAINARRLGYDYRIEGAVIRAQDLFLATAECIIKSGQKVHRVKEILRARDQFMEFIYGDGFDETEAVKIENYFMYFAYIARTQILDERERMSKDAQ